ncbi:MAG: hypothetical protein ACI92A_000342, partial [Candidatus Paceibacteria bacterium]
MKSFFIDVLETYRIPSKVFARKLANGVTEPQLLVWLLFACMISFLVRLPSLILVHQAGNVEGPLQALMAGSLVASVFFAPIFFYVFAAFTALFAKFLGGKGTWQSARLALFWSLIAMQPLVLVTQVMAVQLGPNLITQGIL